MPRQQELTITKQRKIIGKLLAENKDNQATVCGQEQFLERRKFFETLFENYSHAAVVMEMIEYLTLSQIIQLFKDKNIPRKKVEEGMTIATYYRRMYNGGVEKVLANLMDLWVSMGYKVVLYTDEPPTPEDYCYPETVKRIVLPEPMKTQARLSKLEQSLKEEQIDLFIHHGWMSHILLHEILLVKSMNIPFILHTHGHFTALYADCADYVLNSHKVFPLCDLVVSLAEINARFYQLCGCNSYVIQNPIPQELKDIKQQAELKSHKILWIGRIAEGKRFEDALYILKGVKKKVADAELDVVGTEETDGTIERMKEICREEGLLDSVHFHGYQTDVSHFYQEAGLMLMTSEKEGYSLVLLESKAYGVPCVMYKLPYLTMVKDGKGILTAPIGDVDMMVEHIITLLTNHDMRMAIGEEARYSFEGLIEYDLIAHWKEIFRMSVEGIEGPTLLKPLKDTDSLMVEMFMNQLAEGVPMRCNNSLDYIIGQKMLNIPRKIFHVSKVLIQYIKKE